MNPSLLVIAALFLSVFWMVLDEHDKVRPWLVFAVALNIYYGTALKFFMGLEGRLFPVKYDYLLFHLDKALGVSSAAAARVLQGPFRIPLNVIYELMIPMMICWLLIADSRSLRASIGLAYIVELIGGPILYAVVPACGPLYAFHAEWLQPPAVPANPIPLPGLPNAFPSLHAATALVLLFFAPGKWWRVAALIFLAGTCLATVSTGEHYIIDLFGGLAFGCFAAYAGYRRFRHAAAWLGFTLLCSLAVRFEYGFLIAHPTLVRLVALVLVGLTILAVLSEWKRSSPPTADSAAPVEEVCSTAAQ